MGFGYFIVYVITGFLNIIATLIVIQAIMSWFVQAFPDWLRRIYGYINMVTNPFISPFRRLTQRFTYNTGIDFSPLIALIAIQFVSRLITVLFYAL